jgi:multicomponent Na+:H+ antiporter subunit D
MKNSLLLLPILIPFATALASLFVWRHLRVQRVINVIGASALLTSAVFLVSLIWQSGIQAIQLGNWPSPFGITLVADLFSAAMVLLAGIVGLAVAVYSLVSIDIRRESFGYYPLFHILLMGVCGSFLTGDIFNLYVWFEVMLISSFVLLELGSEKAQLEGAIKYVTLNLISSALFLAAVGILYGVVGTLNMAHLSLQLNAVGQPRLVTTLAMMFLVAFGIKAAIFPLFFWLPASYHTPPDPVSAIFAGLLTKVGVYALIRVFTLLFVHDVEYTHRLILIIAAFTMITGVLGAVAQNEFRRILSFHIVSQIGYMILGLGLYTPLALAGSIFYIVHHIIVKTNLFLVSGVASRLLGAYQLKKMGGLYASHPGLAILFMIPALSLAGIPPLSGFWGKFILLRASLDTREYVAAFVALLAGLLTLFSMIKIWSEVFWKSKPEVEGQSSSSADLPQLKSPLLFILPIVALASMTILIGLFCEPVFTYATRAATQLMNPNEYIRSVLGRPM